MLERLIESWLDSASERSYQSPFCQMLAAEGHLIIHSTRHSPIEFGKDVVTIAPDGITCAFQLKGNPGSRLTLNQLREIKSQLLELATQPIIHPSVPSGMRHRCYLVTNGEVDEEVHRSLDDINRELESRGYGASRIELWQRGKLLEMAKQLGSSLWPSEVEDLNVLLELLVHDGTDLLPFEKLHNMLSKLFVLTEDEGTELGAAEAKRRATSAAVLTAVALRNFSLQENHYATICAWTMFIAYWISACERHHIALDNSGKAVIHIARLTVTSAMSALCEDIKSNSKLISRDGMQIGDVHRGRSTLIVGLMSLYWLLLDDSNTAKDEHKKFLTGWIPRDFSHTYIWGEGALPQILAHYWYLSRSDPTASSEHALAAILNAVVLQSEKAPLPGPYFTFEDVMRHKYAEFLAINDDPLSEESSKMSSFFASGLMHLYVRTNNKRSCARIWPNFTKLSHRHFEVEEKWRYGLWRSERGNETSAHTVIPKRWDELVDDARICTTAKVSAHLREDPFILMLFVLMFPYRATPDVVRFLGWKFGTVWFIAPPIE